MNGSLTLVKLVGGNIRNLATHYCLLYFPWSPWLKLHSYKKNPSYVAPPKVVKASTGGNIAAQHHHNKLCQCK